MSEYEKRKNEFDLEFGFILENGIGSPECYYEIRHLYSLGII